ncbi:hypothetical protein K9U40_00150 [Xanthobacter autotrophicus]|uniref:hypothetical protein n=1 Tax=Xanthobacter TaxID=279 RepID=UPI0024AA2F77|nr:hypothetical protein [Xanthobacter autotrophicus]MDI4662754.1 hypothetical protein [Xanthobacter autotrophicus]
MIRCVCAAFVLVATAMPAPALDCPLDQAVYTPLDADDDWGAPEGVANSWEITHPLKPGTSSERPWVIRLAENRQKLAAEFGVADPPGFSATHVFMLVPPEGSRKGFKTTTAPSSLLYYFGDDLKRVDPAGEGRPLAPPLIQLPGLSKAFWNWKREGRRFIPPDGLWKLTGCRA